MRVGVFQRLSSHLKYCRLKGLDTVCLFPSRLFPFFFCLLSRRDFTRRGEVFNHLIRPIISRISCEARRRFQLIQFAVSAI